MKNQEIAEKLDTTYQVVSSYAKGGVEALLAKKE